MVGERGQVAEVEDGQRRHRRIADDRQGEVVAEFDPAPGGLQPVEADPRRVDQAVEVLGALEHVRDGFHPRLDENAGGVQRAGIPLVGGGQRRQALVVQFKIGQLEVARRLLGKAQQAFALGVVVAVAAGHEGDGIVAEPDAHRAAHGLAHVMATITSRPACRSWNPTVVGPVATSTSSPSWPKAIVAPPKLVTTI